MQTPKIFDERRMFIIPGDRKKTIEFSVNHMINISKESIQKTGRFSIALSGGSTPQEIYQKLTSFPSNTRMNWNKVFLFWSDERSVDPENSESNYKMALDAGFKNMPIPHQQCLRMEAENHIEEHAHKYEELIKTHLGNPLFDLVMLGMGEDGHTASLFPNTTALHVHNKLVTANYIPQKNTWRMTLTFPCINQSQHICFYVLGKNKREMLKQIFHENVDLPCQHVGTKEHKALWIMDKDAAGDLFNNS